MYKYSNIEYFIFTELNLRKSIYIIFLIYLSRTCYELISCTIEPIIYSVQKSLLFEERKEKLTMWGRTWTLKMEGCLWYCWMSVKFI